MCSVVDVGSHAIVCHCIVVSIINVISIVVITYYIVCRFAVFYDIWVTFCTTQNAASRAVLDTFPTPVLFSNSVLYCWQRMLSLSPSCDFRMESLGTVFRGHRVALDSTLHDFEEAQSEIGCSKESTGGLEERFRFFQEMRGYVRDLIECLNEKVGWRRV